MTNAEAQFCLIFSMLFAFAVGFTSYNFGALVRYKILDDAILLHGIIYSHG